MSVDENDTNTPDIPVLYSDEEAKHPIAWDKNLASIFGTLETIGSAIRDQRPDIHRLVTTNTVEERGITYIDNTANIDFLEGPALQSKLPDYSFEKPCPPTETKVKTVKTALLLAKEPAHTFTTTLTDAQRKRYSLQTGPVVKLKATFLRILGKIFAITIATKRLYKESEKECRCA